MTIIPNHDSFRSSLSQNVWICTKLVDVFWECMSSDREKNNLQSCGCVTTRNGDLKPNGFKCESLGRIKDGVPDRYSVYVCRLFCVCDQKTAAVTVK